MRRIIVSCFISVLTVTGLAAEGLAQELQSATRDVRGFSVQLVLAEPGAADTGSLSAEAVEAIAKMGNLLPSSRYQVLDRQWLLCCGAPATTAAGLAGRLRAFDGQEYGFAISVTAVPGERFPVRFLLRDEKTTAAATDVSAADVAREIERERTLGDLRRERDELEQAITEMTGRGYGPNHPELQAARTRHGQLERRIVEVVPSQPVTRASPRPLIDTLFTMAPAETLVVGTYSLQGGRTLVVLLTAVPQSTSAH